MGLIKNMRLGTKIGAGFILGLFFTALVGYIGFNSLREVGRSVRSGQEADELLIRLETARKSEIAFILSPREESVKQNQKETAQLLVAVQEMIRRTADPEKLKQLQAVVERVKNYTAAFAEFVEIEAKKSQSAKKMLAEATEVASEAQKLSSQQKLEQDRIKKEINETTAERLWKANTANRLIEMVNSARLLEKEYLVTKDRNTAESVDKVLEQLKTLNEEFLKKLKKKEDQEELASAMKSVNDYQEAFKTWVDLERKRNNEELLMSAAAGEAIRSCEELGANQKRQFEESLTSLDKGQLADKVFLLEGTNQMIKTFNEARLTQKDYLLQSQEELAGAFASYLNKFANLSETMISKTTIEKDLKLIKQAGTTVAGYGQSFEKLISLHDQQRLATSRLSASADKFMKQMAALAANQLAQITKDREDADKVEADSALRTSQADQLIKLILTSRLEEKEYVLLGQEESVKNLHQSAEEIIKLAKGLTARLASESAKALATMIAETAENYRKGFDGYRGFKQRQVEIQKTLAESQRAVEQLCQLIQSREKDQIVVINKRSDWVIFSGTGLAIFFGLILAFFITRGITGPIKRSVALAAAIREGDLSQRAVVDSTNEVGHLAQAFNEMAETLDHKAGLATSIAAGDLTKEVALASEKDALGRALQGMTVSLNEVLGQVHEAIMQVAGGAGQVSDSSQSLSQGASEQAAALQQITSIMSEVGSQIKLSAETAGQANQLATQAQEAAENGNRRMETMTAAMKDINDSSRAIAKIIKTIDDIAFQTNLLALNAAVEAARAGVHGKGFAVVAQEVRNLAGRSAKAAQETTDLIEGSMKRVENGSVIVKQTAQALSEIYERVAKVAALIGEISQAANSQAQGIAEVNQGLGQIEKVTQQNTANAEETASAAEELSSQSMQLRQLISRFKLKKLLTAGEADLAAPSEVLKASTRRLPPPASPALRPAKTARALLADHREATHLDDKKLGKH